MSKEVHSTPAALARRDENVPADAHVHPLPAGELQLYREDPTREARLGFTERVCCRECGVKFKILMPGHLRKHGLTFEQYKSKYPGSATASPDSLNRRGLGIKNAWARQEVQDRQHKAKRAVFADPVKGVGVRAGLAKGRTLEVRAVAAETLRTKCEADATYPEKMVGPLRRARAEAQRNPEKQAHWNENISRTLSTPEHKARQSAIAKRTWARREAQLAPGRIIEQLKSKRTDFRRLALCYLANPDLGRKEAQRLAGTNLSPATVTRVREFLGFMDDRAGDSKNKSMLISRESQTPVPAE